MIRLIATDLDNTLLDSTGVIPESTAALLQRAAQQGVCTAVATGRCYPSALAAAKTIGAATPVICYNGSLIKWGDTGEVLAKSYVEVDTMRKIAAYCHERGLFFQGYDYDDVIICEADGPGLRRDPDLAVAGFRAVGDFLTYPDLHPTPKMLIVDRAASTASGKNGCCETSAPAVCNSSKTTFLSAVCILIHIGGRVESIFRKFSLSRFSGNDSFTHCGSRS